MKYRKVVSAPFMEASQCLKTSTMTGDMKILTGGGRMTGARGKLHYDNATYCRKLAIIDKEAFPIELLTIKPGNKLAEVALSFVLLREISAEADGEAMK